MASIPSPDSSELRKSAPLGHIRFDETQKVMVVVRVFLDFDSWNI